MGEVVKEKDRIIIPSSLAYLREVDDFVEEKLNEQEIDPSLVSDIAISVTEVVTNAISHGNKNDLHKKVSVTLQINKKQVRVKIEDQGTGFDPEHLANPLADENLLREAGRGVFIVKSLMDEVKFEVVPNSGTTVVLVKNL